MRLEAEIHGSVPSASNIFLRHNDAFTMGTWRIRTHCAVIRSDHYDIVYARVDDVRFDTVLGTAVDITQCEWHLCTIIVYATTAAYYVLHNARC